MTLQLIPVDKIEVNWNLNRARDDAHVRAIASHINERGFDKNYPVRIVKMESDGSFYLGAGFHRLAAAAGEHIEVGDGEYQADLTFTNLPIAAVWAEVILGDFDKLVDIIQRDNFQHDPALHSHLGLALTQTQKKEQCLRLLMFPPTFKKDVRELGAEFGIGKSTAGNWKDVVCERVLEIADMQLSDEDLLNQYSLTPGRFSEMLILVKSARSARVDKKDSARARAKAEFETSKSSVQNLIDEICDELFSLDRADVQRRLFSHFGISGADIADMSSEELKKERAAFSELQADLQNRKRSLWWHEFRCFHNAYQLRSELEGLGPNFEIDESVRAVERAREIDTARFESQARDARLTELESLKNFLPGAIDRENAAREKQVKAHDELKNVCALASRACSSLVKEFRKRALQPDAVGQNFRAFISAALEFSKEPRGYSDTLSVAEMTNPSDLKNTGRAYAVRGVAEKLRADLTSDEPPAWMHSFLKVQNPPPPAENPVPVLPSSVEKARASEPSAPARISNRNPDLINLPTSPGAAAATTSEKSERAGADTRASVQKSDNENAEGAVVETASPRSGISDLENALQIALDSLAAVLPDSVETAHGAKAEFSELIRNLSSNQLERIAIYHALFLGELTLLKKK